MRAITPRVAVVAGGIAALVMILAAMFSEEPVEIIYRTALAVGLVAIALFVASRSTLTPEMLERARQQGYDGGYADGCDAARPSRMSSVSGSSPRRAAQ